MALVRIFCHADIQVLQDRSDQTMSVELVSLESVRIASDSCALLLNLIARDSQYPENVSVFERRYWYCPQMNLLSLVAGVALELHKIKHDMSPLLVFQEAKLEGGFLKNLLLLKNSAVTLVRLAKDAKEIVEEYVESSDEDDVHALDVLLGKVKEFGQVVEDTADFVPRGTHNIAWLQARLPSVLDPVDLLLSTPVHFLDPY